MSENHNTSVSQSDSAFSLLGKSLEIVKRNWKTFALVNALSLVLAAIEFFPADEISNNKLNSSGNFWAGLSGFELGTVVGAGLIFLLLFAVVGLLLYAMSIILSVKVSENKSPSISDLFTLAKKYWLRLLGLMIVSGFIVVVGLFLLIIPGVIAIGRLAMASFVMVDKDLGIMESIKLSNQIGKEHGGMVWRAIGVTILVGIASSIINSISKIGPLLATIFSIAFSLVMVLRYQQLKKLGATKN